MYEWERLNQNRIKEQQGGTCHSRDWKVPVPAGPWLGSEGAAAARQLREQGWLVVA